MAGRLRYALSAAGAPPRATPALPVALPRERDRSPLAAGREPARILVSVLCPIGDTLLATPALAALRRRFPAAEITAIVSASNSGILDGNPAITRRLLVPTPGEGPSAWRAVEALRALGRERDTYDLVINLSAAGKIATTLAGVAGPHLGLAMPPLWWLVGGHSAALRGRHAVDHYLSALAPLVGRDLTAEERVPRLYLTLAERSAARRLLRQHGLSPSHALVAMHVGGDGFDGRKRWGADRFAEVATHLMARCQARVLLIGGKADVPQAETVAARIAGGAALLAGQTSLKVTAALIEQALLFIGNDSGPLHMAAAVGTPAIGIFGPSDWQQFAPIGRAGFRQRAVHSSLPCSPCFRFVGHDPWWYRNPCRSEACLRAITPQQVLDAALEMLAR